MRTTLLVVITQNYEGRTAVVSTEKFVFDRFTDAVDAKSELIEDYADGHDCLSVKVTLMEGTA